MTAASNFSSATTHLNRPQLTSTSLLFLFLFTVLESFFLSVMVDRKGEAQKSCRKKKFPKCLELRHQQTDTWSQQQDSCRVLFERCSKHVKVWQKTNIKLNEMSSPHGGSAHYLNILKSSRSWMLKKVLSLFLIKSRKISCLNRTLQSRQNKLFWSKNKYPKSHDFMISPFSCWFPEHPWLLEHDCSLLVRFDGVCMISRPGSSLVKVDNLTWASLCRFSLCSFFLLPCSLLPLWFSFSSSSTLLCSFSFRHCSS